MAPTAPTSPWLAICNFPYGCGTLNPLSSVQAIMVTLSRCLSFLQLPDIYLYIYLSDCLWIYFWVYLFGCLWIFQTILHLQSLSVSLTLFVTLTVTVPLPLTALTLSMVQWCPLLSICDITCSTNILTYTPQNCVIFITSLTVGFETTHVLSYLSTLQQER